MHENSKIKHSISLRKSGHVFANSITLKHSNLKVFYKRVFEPFNVLF